MSTSSPEPTRPAAAQSAPVSLDEHDLQPLYVNFCRVSSTPEEVILDLGLNSNTPGSPVVPVEIGSRVVLSHYTAKRLTQALSAAIQRYEQTFGNLELDIQKRARGG